MDIISQSVEVVILDDNDVESADYWKKMYHKKNVELVTFKEKHEEFKERLSKWHNDHVIPTDRNLRQVVACLQQDLAAQQKETVYRNYMFGQKAQQNRDLMQRISNLGKLIYRISAKSLFRKPSKTGTRTKYQYAIRVEKTNA